MAIRASEEKTERCNSPLGKSLNNVVDRVCRTQSYSGNVWKGATGLVGRCDIRRKEDVNLASMTRAHGND